MKGDHAVSALSRKRAELAGEVIRAKARLKRLQENLAHVDATLRLFDPDADPAAIKPLRPRKPPRLFRHGELPRLILSALREHGPADAHDVTSAVMRGAGMDPADVELLPEVLPRVRETLRHLSVWPEKS